MELLAAFEIVCATDVPTLPPSLRSSASKPTAAPRSSRGMYMNAATFSGAKSIDRPAMTTTRGQTTCHGLMSRFMQRHPVIPDRKRQQSAAHEIARIDAACQQNADDKSIMIANIPAGESTRPDVSRRSRTAFAAGRAA